MIAKKCIRMGIFIAVAAAAALVTVSSALGQSVAPIRYVFGPNSFTDSKGQVWSPAPTFDLTGSSGWRWSTCAKTAVFTGTPDPGLYQEQIVQDSGDLMFTVAVPSGAYTVNLYFAEPCSYYTAGERAFGVSLNGSTVVPRLDLAAAVGVEKPVIESATVSDAQIALDLKPITDHPVIAAIEILPASSSFLLTAKLAWDDGTPVAGTVEATQEISTNPPKSKSLGSFPLDANGRATANLTPDLALPLTFSFTLIDPTGAIVNTLKFSCDSLTLKAFPRTLNPSIVLNKSSVTLKSFSF